jgi:cytochrome b subunit of formate dehydrogenase
MKKKERFFLRFTLNQRLQHVLLITTFIILVVTGLPLKYSDSEISQAFVSLMGGWEMRSHIHHIAGVLLIALGIYHVIFYLATGRKKAKKILPRFQDFKDFWQEIKHFFGKAKRPRYDRYSWREKFEYWAIVWGLIVMAITGIFMLYPAESAQFFGSYGWVEVAWIAHSNEALLAVLAIVIWHLWNVHFHPKKFPMSKVWITGKMTEKEMMEEHPIEYDEIIIKKKKPKEKPEKPEPQKTPDKKGVVTEKI